MDFSPVIGLALLVASIPIASLVVRMLDLRWPDARAAWLCLPAALVPTAILLLFWYWRITHPMHGEDWGALLALYLGAVTVPACLPIALVTAILVLRGERRRRRE